MCVWLVFLRPHRSVFVVQNRETQLDRRSHYLNTSTVSPVISPQATSRLDMCVGGCVFECVSEESRETNSHHRSHPSLYKSWFTIKFHLWKFMRRKQSPKEWSCAQFLCVAVSLCGKYVHICTYRASAGWRIHQQCTIHMYSEPGVYFLLLSLLLLYLNIERSSG